MGPWGYNSVVFMMLEVSRAAQPWYENCAFTPSASKAVPAASVCSLPMLGQRLP